MNRWFVSVLLVATINTALAQVEDSHADDMGYWEGFKVDTLGMEKGAKPFYFRAGYTSLQPDSSSSEVVLSDVGGPASLAIENGPIAGSGAEVEGADFPSAIVGYTLPWLDGHLAVETVLALPFTVEFKGTGTIANESIAPFALGNIPTGVPPLGEEFGETKVLPPVVTLVYRFRLDKPLRPYLGAGLSYMITYDEKVTNPILTALGEPGLEVEDVFGFAFQGGVEYNFYENWWVNFDVKFIAGLEAEAKVTNIWVETPGLPLYDVARVGDATINVTVDPWVYHLGVGFDF